MPSGSAWRDVPNIPVRFTTTRDGLILELIKSVWEQTLNWTLRLAVQGSTP